MTQILLWGRAFMAAVLTLEMENERPKLLAMKGQSFYITFLFTTS